MRYLVHLGLFMGALVAVTSAEAQPNRRVDREVNVVIAGHGHPKHHGQKHNKRVKYVKHDNRVPPGRAYGHHKEKAKYRLHDERRDLRQIEDISRAWRRAVATRDHYQREMADRRLAAWIERELYEARRERAHPHYVRQVRELRRELNELNWRLARGYAQRHDFVRKSRILDHLVVLSERQVQRARAYERYPRRPYYAVR